MKTKSILLILALSLSLVGCGGGGGDSKPYDCSINNVIETTDNGDAVDYTFKNNVCNNVTAYSKVNNVLSSITYDLAEFVLVVEYPQQGIRKATRYKDGTKFLEVNYEEWNNYIEVITYLNDGGISYDSYTSDQTEFLIYLLDTSVIVSHGSVEQASNSASID